MALSDHQLRTLRKSFYACHGEHQGRQQGERGHYQELQPRQLDSRHSGCTAQHRPGQRHHVDTAIQHDVHEAMAHRHLQRSGQAPQHADVLAANGQHPLTASRLALTG